MEALETSDDMHRILVMNALGKIGDPRPISKIHSIATDRTMFGLVRVRAMAALARLGDPSSD
jgi:HEAT repeat protein